MSKHYIMYTLAALILPCAFAVEPESFPDFTVGEREVVATKEERDDLGLKWFMDGNLGVLKAGDKFQFYGANGSKPVRVTGPPDNPLQKMEPVAISTKNGNFRYLSGGPLYHDPLSKRIFLFYHAEIHRGNARNFYSVLGLSIQIDEDGLEFKDLGPIFMANISDTKADSTVETCGAPYIIKDGYFYLYARDVFEAENPKQSNLSVARAKVSEVVQAGLEGRSTKWMKYYNNAFSEPAISGKSTPLESGNPGTRWMDVSYNTTLEKYIMVVSANTTPGRVELFITNSSDGVHWEKRTKLVEESGESFYPSIVGFKENPRQSGKKFYVYYTYSAKGEWDGFSKRTVLLLSDPRSRRERATFSTSNRILRQ